MAAAGPLQEPGHRARQQVLQQRGAWPFIAGGGLHRRDLHRGAFIAGGALIAGGGGDRLNASSPGALIAGGGGEGRERREAEACPLARRLSRWHHSVPGSFGQVSMQLGNTFLSCEEDGRWIGPVHVQPRVDAVRLERSDWLFSIINMSARLRYSRRPCRSAIVRSEDQPKKCLVRLEMPSAGFHLHSLLYALPGGLGNVIRRTLMPLDDQERHGHVAQVMLEVFALVTLIFCITSVSWLVGVPQVTPLLRRLRWTAPGEAREVYSPGKYQAMRPLSVHPREFDDAVVDSIGAGSEFEVLEVQHHSDGELILGLVAKPAGWIRLRDDGEPQRQAGASKESFEPPAGIELPPLSQVYGSVVLCIVMFVFSFLYMMCKALEIVPLYSPSPFALSSVLAFPVLFGVRIAVSIWVKGCRYISYQVALRHGKLFCPAVHEGQFDWGFMYGLTCYAYLVMVVSHAVLVGCVEGDLSLSAAALSMYSCFTALVFNVKSLWSFENMEREVRLGVCVAHIAKQPRHQEALHDHVDCTIRLSLPVLHEHAFVAAGRRGLSNLLENPRVEQITTGFRPTDAVWFSRFMADCGPQASERGSWLAKAWPLAVIAMVTFQASLFIGTSTRQSLLRPVLTGAWMLTGTSHTPVVADLHDLTVYVDKDLSRFALYAQTEAMFVSSMTFGMAGAGKGAVRSSNGSMLAVQQMSSRKLHYPPRWELSVHRGAKRTTYSIHVQPISRVITSVSFTGNVCRDSSSAGATVHVCKRFSLCRSLGVVRTFRSFLPDNVTDLEISMEVSEHVFGIPGAQAGPGLTYTTFEHGEQVRSMTCRNRCEQILSCVDYIHTLTGCYFVHAEDQHVCSRFRRLPGKRPTQSRAGAAGPHQHGLRQVTMANNVPNPRAHVCHAGKDGLVERCRKMQWDEDGSVLRLANFSMRSVWQSAKATLTLRYALFPNAFLSDIERASVAIRLKRGTSDLMSLLSFVDVDKLQVKVIRSDEPRLTVVLSEYNALELEDDLTLFLTPLLHDSTFSVHWSTLESGVKVETSAPPNFPECGENFAFALFDACGGERKSRTMKFTLNKWSPFQEHVINIRPKSKYKEFYADVRIPITVTTENGTSPIVWLLRRSCTLPEHFFLCDRTSAHCIAASDVAAEIERCPFAEAVKLLHTAHVSASARDPEAYAVMLFRFLKGHAVNKSFIENHFTADLYAMPLWLLDSAADKAGVRVQDCQPLFEVAFELRSTLDFVREIGDLSKRRAFRGVMAATKGRRGPWPFVKVAMETECTGCLHGLEEMLPDPVIFGRPLPLTPPIRIEGRLSQRGVVVLMQACTRFSSIASVGGLSLLGSGRTWKKFFGIMPKLSAFFPCMKAFAGRRLTLTPEEMGRTLLPALAPASSEDWEYFYLAFGNEVNNPCNRTGVEEVDLSENDLADEHLAILTRWLPRLHTLRSLNISLNSRLGVASVEALAAALPGAPLERLVVSPTHAVSAVRWRSLEASLRQLRENFAVDILNISCVCF